MTTSEITPVELVGSMSATVHITVKWVHLLGTVQGAETIRTAMDTLIADAQDLRGRADAVLTCDEAVVETAVFDDVMGRLHGEAGGA